MRFLITSALPYINGIKHLGNAAGSMLPADMYARFRRQQGHEVLFICGTDEHGTPAELAARDAGMSVKAYCAVQHEAQRRVSDAFHISFDNFGRTSSVSNHLLTQHFADRLEDAGLLEERVDQQLFSIADDRFLPDRYVEGTCPHCGFGDARGDQCDGCGSQLDPLDLIEPRSKISGSRAVVRRETRHLYLRQSVMAERVRAWVESRNFPKVARSIANKWLDEGLKDRSITRDLSWGVQVLRRGLPRSGFESKVFYVWFDAPIGYIAATVDWADANGEDWQRWWREDKGAHDVNYVEFMGKDNVGFHTVSFPITLLGSGEPWKLVDRIKAMNWLTWYGDKFSTSRGRGIFMDQALDILPADVWRWVLLSGAPENSDSALTVERVQAVNNADLSNNLGNFASRVTKFCAAEFEGRVPADGKPGDAEAALVRNVAEKIAAITAAHEVTEIRKAADAIRELWQLANVYLATAAPWAASRTNRDKAAMATRTGLSLLALIACVSEPFIPATSAAIRALFPEQAIPLDWPSPDRTPLLPELRPGSQVLPAGMLFPRITDVQVSEWEDRFGALAKHSDLAAADHFAPM